MAVQEEMEGGEVRDVADLQLAVAKSGGTRLLRRSSIAKPTCKSTTRPTKNKKKPNAQQLVAAAEAARLPPQMSAGRPLSLFICSIGNPGAQYANTLHSAGHTVLNRLVEYLGYPQFTKDKSHGGGYLSRSPISGGPGDWTLYSTRSYMNESGKEVRQAYLTWAKNVPEGEGRLVVVHDELERALGAVNIRLAGTSVKGHNGLKSIKASMPNIPMARIGIGIGRPESRASDDVAAYVLRKMTPNEKTAIEATVDQVVDKLRQLEEG